MKTTAFFLLFITSFGYSQENKLINSILNKYNAVKDYKVDATIYTNVPMIKMKEVDAKFFFMQKDKFKIKTDGIAVLPKQGLNNLMKFISNKENYTAIPSEEEVINNIKAKQFILIPKDDNSDIVMCRLWISVENPVILKSLTTTKSSGTVKVNYTYTDNLSFGLPSKIIFEIDVKKFKMPKSISANIHNTKKSSNNNGGKGEITVLLYNYEINKGKGKSVF